MEKNLLYTLVLLIGFLDFSYSQNCISNISVETNCIDAFNFEASIEFDYTTDVSDMVYISDINGFEYGMFDPSQQPIKVDVLLHNSIMNLYGFIITSAQDPSCSEQSALEVVFCNNCKLEVSNLTTECLEGTDNYLMGLKVTHSGSIEVNEFILRHTGTGQLISTFETTSSAQTIEVELPTSVQGNFTVSSPDGQCATTFNSQTDCSITNECSISNVSFTTQCIDAFNFNVSIEFDYDSEHVNMVYVSDLHGNDYGMFNPNQQPITVEVPLSNSTMNDFEFTITDTQNVTCSAKSETQIVHCNSCELEVDNLTHECIDEDNYVLKLDVQNNGYTAIDRCEIMHAATGQFIGSFAFYTSSQNRVIEVELPIDLQGEFMLYDPNGSCYTSTIVELECTSEQMKCDFISNVSFETICIDAFNFRASIDFDYEADNISMVSISDSNGNEYGTFEANDQPISIDVLLLNSIMNEFRFIITDTQDVTCFAQSETQLIFCNDCEIEVNNISGECINENRYVLNLEVNNQGFTPIDRLELMHVPTGQFIGMFALPPSSQTRVIEVELPIDLQGEFMLYDPNGSCSATAVVVLDCTHEPECSIANVTFETQCLNAYNFTASIEFDYQAEAASMVSVSDLSGNVYGEYDASEQPLLVLVPKSSSTTDEFVFIVSDTQNSACSAQSETKVVLCDECQLEVNNLSDECLEEDMYILKLGVKNNGNTKIDRCELIHLATGQFIGMFALPTTSQAREIEVQLPTDLQGEFVIYDPSSGCSATTTVILDCTPEPACSISNVSFETQCSGALNFNAFIEFDYEPENIGMVSISDLNGNEYGEFAANQQPISVDVPLSNSTMNETAFIITEAQNATCSAQSNSQVVICNDCQFEVENLMSECMGETGKYLLILRVQNTGTTPITQFVLSHNESGQVIDTYNMPAISQTLTIQVELQNEIQGGFTLSDLNGICSETISIQMDCSTAAECEIKLTDLSYTCEFNQLYLDLAVNGNSMNDFDVLVNGITIGVGSSANTFNQFGPIAQNSDGYYLVEVIDQADTNCNDEFKLQQAFCEDEPTKCLIENIELDDIDCMGESEFELLLNFDYDSNDVLPLRCVVNGEAMPNATTADLPLQLSGMTSNQNVVLSMITICVDEFDQECCIDYTFEHPTCLANSTIDNTLLDGVEINPNPTTDFLHINEIPTDIIGFEIVDNIGRTIKQIMGNQNVRLDVSSYNDGLYIIQFFTKDNKVMSRRFIKF